jgi:hypothetical protein
MWDEKRFGIKNNKRDKQILMDPIFPLRKKHSVKETFKNKAKEPSAIATGKN